MVASLRKWLGVDALESRVASLERENLTLAKSVLGHAGRIKAIEESSQKSIENQKPLTRKAEKSKIVAKNWSQVRSMLEREPEE